MRFLPALLLCLLAATGSAAQTKAETPPGRVQPPVALQAVQISLDEVAQAKHRAAEKTKAFILSIKAPAKEACDPKGEDSGRLETIREWQLAIKNSASEDAILGMASGMLTDASWPRGFWQRAASGQFNIAAH